MKLNYVAPDDHTGYGVAAAQYVRHLREAGYQVAFQPLRPGRELGLWYECGTPAEPLHPDADSVLHVVPEYYPALVAWVRKAGISGRVIAMTTWESSRLPEKWPGILNSMDGVIVPSEWNREVFVASGVASPVYVLPHISEFGGEIAMPASIPPALVSLRRSDTKTVFYSIATQMHRKGNDLLLAAFQLAFPKREDVRLVLKTSPRDLEPSPWRRFRTMRDLIGLNPLARAAARDKRILLIQAHLTSTEIASLHALSDCYATCTRGEGWGIGLYEAMLLGKPALAPSHGGHRAFFEDDRSPNLIRSELVATRSRRGHSQEQEEEFWVETNVHAMARRMREVDAQLDLCKQEAALDAVTMRARFHPAAITRQFGDILEVLRTAKTRRNSTAEWP